MFLMFHAPDWEKTDEAKDAVWEVLFEKENIPLSPIRAPVLTMMDPQRGFGFAYPKASELQKFGVPHSILHTRSKENLLCISPKPEWVVVKPVTTYKILTLYSKCPFVVEFVLDEELMAKAEEILKADSICVGMPCRELLFACATIDCGNPSLIPNFNEFIKLQYRESKASAGPPITPTVFHFKGGVIRGYVKEEGPIEEPKVQEVLDID